MVDEKIDNKDVRVQDALKIYLQKASPDAEQAGSQEPPYKMPAETKSLQR